MRKIKDVLHLKLDAQLSHERIAASLGNSCQGEQVGGCHSSARVWMSDGEGRYG